MKVTLENIDQIDAKYYRSKDYVEALLDDIKDINWRLDCIGLQNLFIELDWQDYHDEYSPERVDPCPDFYGYWSIVRSSDQNVIGGMSNDLSYIDDIILALYGFIS